LETYLVNKKKLFITLIISVLQYLRQSHEWFLNIRRERKVRKGRIRSSSKHPAAKLTMNEVIAILNTLSPQLTPRIVKQMILIVEAMVAMTGRVTLLGLSRWTEKGGSYRTVQRFFKENTIGQRYVGNS
jgi:hypothetical protein